MVNVCAVAPGSAGYTLVDSKKGSMGNRIDCATKQFANNVVYGAKFIGISALGTGSMIGVGKLLKNANPAWHTKINNYIVTKFPKFLKKIGETSLKTKSLALLGIATGLALINIIKNHAFKAGQIDQRYNDRAVTQNNNLDNV